MTVFLLSRLYDRVTRQWYPRRYCFCSENDRRRIILSHTIDVALISHETVSRPSRSNDILMAEKEKGNEYLHETRILDQLMEYHHLSLVGEHQMIY